MAHQIAGGDVRNADEFGKAGSVGALSDARAAQENPLDISTLPLGILKWKSWRKSWSGSLPVNVGCLGAEIANRGGSAQHKAAENRHWRIGQREKNVYVDWCMTSFLEIDREEGWRRGVEPRGKVLADKLIHARALECGLREKKN